MGHGVMDSIVGRGPADLGSIPSVSTNLGDNMKMKIKQTSKKMKQEQPSFTRNGITFDKHPRRENCWIYHGRMPTSSCWIFINDDSIQIENVIVINPKQRNSGHGKSMISDIRMAFPDYNIWVDTWNCTRPFWKKMVDSGYIDGIANDYSWPCINTTCTICHETRNYPRREVFQ